MNLNMFYLERANRMKNKNSLRQYNKFLTLAHNKNWRVIDHSMMMIGSL